MAKIKVSYLLIITLLYVFAYLVRCLRWHFLLKNVKNISPLKLFPHLMIGFFVNNILPMRIGEFARAYVSGKKLQISKTTSFASIVVERTFDGICFLALLLISFSFMPFPGWVKKGGSAAGVFFIVMMGMLFFLAFHPEKLSYILSKVSLSETLKLKINNLLKNFLLGLQSLRSLKTIVIVLLLSFLVWSLELVCFYLMSCAFNINISFIHIVFTAMCISLGVMVPAASGYIGTYEFAGKTGLVIAGVDPSLAISFILFLHFYQIVIVSLMGFPSLLMQGISLKELKEKG